MFEKKNKEKIKNGKIYSWRMELSCFSFDIVYRIGKDNVPADTFTRIYCSLLIYRHYMNFINLCFIQELHE